MITDTDNIIINEPAIRPPAIDHADFTGRHHFLNRYITRKKWKLAWVVLLGLISSCASFLLTVIIGNFFMLRFHTGSSKGKLLLWLGIKLETINAFFILFIMLLILKFVSSFFEQYLLQMHGEAFVKSIRLQLFESQIRSSVEKFTNKQFGNYLLRYSNDMKAIQNYISKGILVGIKQFLFVALGFFLLYKINWQLAVILIALFSLTLSVIILLSMWQKKTIRLSRNKRSNLLAMVARNFSRFRLLKKEGKEEMIIERFEYKSQQLYETNLINGRIESAISSVASLLQLACIGFVLWLMAGHGIHISSADGLVVILILMLMQGAFRSLLKIPSHLNKGAISLEKINELIAD